MVDLPANRREYAFTLFRESSVPFPALAIMELLLHRLELFQQLLAFTPAVLLLPGEQPSQRVLDGGEHSLDGPLELLASRHHAVLLLREEIPCRLQCRVRILARRALVLLARDGVGQGQGENG